MPISRRLLLGVSTLATLPPLAGALSAPVTSRRDLRDPFVSLQAFVDVLIPPDDMPGAGDVDVHGRIIRKAAGIPAYLKLLSVGCRWLDLEAQKLDGNVQHFRDLESDTKIRIVELAAAERPKAVGRVFFRNVLADTKRFYYSSPEVWAALDYHGPPQPGGFLDFDQPRRPPEP